MKKQVNNSNLDMLNKPNFLIVGPPKSGTSSLFHYLKQHPEVFVSRVKEPFYFTSEIMENISKEDPMLKSIMNYAHFDKSQYFKLFDDAKNEKWLGEASVNYLYYYKHAIPKIKKELGDIRIILILRNPINRAFSNYNYQLTGQKLTFEESLEIENNRIRQNFNSFWFYKESGLYYDSVKAYIDVFSKVKVFFFDDLKNNPNDFMKDIFKFLDVETSFVPNTQIIHNKTFIVKHKWIRNIIFLKKQIFLKNKFEYKLPVFLSSIIRRLFYSTKNKSKMNLKTKKYLINYYKDDVKKLSDLLNKDLNHWLR